MIHFNTNNKKYLAVDVPEGATDIRYYDADKPFVIFNADRSACSVLIPSGTYSIVGIAGELSEGQCEGIVEVGAQEGGYKAFVDYRDEDGYHHTAAQSFASLLRANAIPAHYLILKIQ